MESFSSSAKTKSGKKYSKTDFKKRLYICGKNIKAKFKLTP